MSVTISILDDNSVHLAQLRDFVQAAATERGLPAIVKYSTCVEDFLPSYKTSLPDLAFIDIVLDGQDGFQVAQSMRRQGMDSELVFVTAYIDRMPEAFNYRPIGFLEKPVTLEKTREIIERFCFYHWHDDKYYLVRNKNNALRIAHREIALFASENHQIKLTKTDGEVLCFKGKLDDVQRELSSCPYVRCHKSFLVSLNAIDYMDKSKQIFVLKNGIVVPISRACYPSASRRFMEF